MLIFYYQTITSTNLKRKRAGNCNYKSKSNALLFLSFMHMKYGLSLLQNRLSPFSMALHCLVFNNWAETRVIIRFLITEEISMSLQMWRLSLEPWGRHHASMGESILHAVSLECLPSMLYINGLLCRLLVHNCCFLSALAILSHWIDFGLGQDSQWNMSRCDVHLICTPHWAEAFNVLAWFGPEWHSGWGLLHLGP